MDFSGDQAIGRVLKLDEVKGKGIWTEARVDFQPEGSPLRHVYEGVRKGSIRNFSLAGFFHRTLTPEGWRISKVDATELSITPVSVHPRTRIVEVEQKSLESRLADIDIFARDIERVAVTAELLLLQRRMAELAA